MSKTTSHQDWVVLGLSLLEEGRHPADVTLDAAAGMLGVTKGSFTHHFANADAWYDDVLAAWSKTRARDREINARHASVMRDPLERLRAMRLNAAVLASSDAGMRAWAATGGPGAEAAAKALEEVRAPVGEQVAVALRDLRMTADEVGVMTRMLLREFGSGPGDPSIPLDDPAGFEVLLRVLSAAVRDLQVTSAVVPGEDGLMVFVAQPQGSPVMDAAAMAEVARFARSQMPALRAGAAANGDAQTAAHPAV